MAFAISKKQNIQVVVIDPQNDFCDIPESETVPRSQDGSYVWRPALPVPGSHQDMLRMGELIRKAGRGLADITVTLDSHHYIGIERPTFWVDGEGNQLAEFTCISSQSILEGKTLPRNMQLYARVLAYVQQLEAQARYPLMLWPVHCEIGTFGHAVHDAVRTAYNQWELNHVGIVNKITKGSNPLTEHYSVFAAEVPDPADPSTQVNVSLINSLRDSLVLLGGEAGSHCFRSSVEHLVQYIGNEHLKNLVLLTDCTSPVSGFEKEYEDFLKRMSAAGLQLATSDEVLPELLQNGRR